MIENNENNKDSQQEVITIKDYLSEMINTEQITMKMLSKSKNSSKKNKINYFSRNKQMFLF